MDVCRDTVGEPVCLISSHFALLPQDHHSVTKTLLSTHTQAHTHAHTHTYPQFVHVSVLLYVC